MLWRDRICSAGSKLILIELINRGLGNDHPGPQALTDNTNLSNIAKAAVRGACLPSSSSRRT